MSICANEEIDIEKEQHCKATVLVEYSFFSYGNILKRFSFDNAETSNSFF